MPSRELPPIHPGEILFEEFMKPLGITINGLARDLCVPPTRIQAIVTCERSITADTALRLARYFGTTPGFWASLQANYDLEVAQRESAEDIERRVHPLSAPVH
jgi:antitoxin HigA-1